MRVCLQLRINWATCLTYMGTSPRGGILRGRRLTRAAHMMGRGLRTMTMGSWAGCRKVRRTRRISRCRPSTRYMNINMGGLERLTRLLLTSDIYNIGQPVKHATVLLISRVGVQCPCSTCCTYVLGAWNGMTVISVSARSTEPKSQCGDQRVSLRLMVARAFFVCRPSRSPCMVPHGPLHRL
jgi:hypothetical protein